MKGDPRAGRPKGSRNKTPVSVRALLEQLAAERPEVYRDAILRGLAAGGAKSYPFVALAAAYIDGKPVERVALVQSQRLLFIPMGSTPDLGDGDADQP